MKLENVLKDFQHEILLLGKNNHDFRVSMFVFKVRFIESVIKCPYMSHWKKSLLHPYHIQIDTYSVLDFIKTVLFNLWAESGRSMSSLFNVWIISISFGHFNIGLSFEYWVSEYNFHKGFHSKPFVSLYLCFSFVSLGYCTLICS